MVSLETAVMALALLSGGQAAGETVLLDFYADWCIPCRQMEPAVRELVARGYPVRKVNVDREPALAAQFGAPPVPCFVMLVDGQVVDRVVGGTTFSRLEQMCKMGLSSRSGGVQQAGPQDGSSAPPSTAAGANNPGPSAHTGHPAAGPGDSPSPAPIPPPPGWRLANPGASLDTASGQICNELIAATVRLRIEDPDGHSCGSGTIIDARDGEALILTCGHIFRDSKGTGAIRVDLFGPTPAKGLPARLLSDAQGRLCYDLRRDIGLVTIRTPGPVAAARVAPPGYRVAKDDRVITVGCNNGQPPTACPSRITSVDKYQGPPNLQVAGMPVQGRSGGGLFSEDGYLIGVCNAADPADNEGFYTAIAAIQAELDDAGVAFVYRSGDGTSAPEALVAAHVPPPMPKRMPRPSDIAKVAEAPPISSPDRGERESIDRLDRPHGEKQLQPLSGEEQAALEEIRRRRSEGAEVICVIRSRSDPQAPSEVIVLDRVSPAFLERLAAESRTARRNARHLTSLEIPALAPVIPRRDDAPTRSSSSVKTLLEYSSDGRGNAGTADRVPWQPRWRESAPRR